MPCALPPSLLCRSAFVPRPCVFARFASTRARNLAARHWDLVRDHSPHPATQHVIDHQATKARIADQTGLKVTTDTVPSSTPKEVFIRGVRIPLRPKPPESDECCMSGCAVCVYDLYLSSLDDYKQELATTVAQLQERDVPRYEWPDEVRQVEKMEHMKEVEGDPLEELSLDPSMKAFLMLEKKLGQKK